MEPGLSRRKFLRFRRMRAAKGDQVRRAVSDECRVESAEKNMKKKITILTLCAMLFALCFSAEAQQPGKSSASVSWIQHCFW